VIMRIKTDVLCEPMKNLLKSLLSEGIELHSIKLIENHFNDNEIKFKKEINCSEKKSVKLME